MSELIFEKDYELLQEVTYAYKGNTRSTKKVILKAPTFKQADKLEQAERQLSRMTAFTNFIADSGLIVAKEDGTEIPSASLNDLHIKAVLQLVADYNKFFLASELSEIESKSGA